MTNNLSGDVMRGILVLGLVVFLSFGVLEAKNNHQVGLKLGLTSIDNKDGWNFEKGTFFVDLLFDTPTFIKPRIDVGYVNINEEDKGGVSSLLQLALNGVYEFDLTSYNTPLKPYILAGLGYERVFDDTPVFESQIFMQAGFGLEHPLGNHINLISEFRALQMIDSSESNEDNEFVVTVGISVPLFVNAVQGQVAQVSAPAIQYQESVYIDSDGDGVADNIDKCPNTPMGKDIDSRGCMIVNAIVIPEDVVFVEDVQAIPLAPVVYVEKKSAPISIKKNRKNLQVNFESSSAVILSGSKRHIKEFSTFLKNNPKTTVTIEGYTDNSGIRNKNFALSKQRARAVRTFLIRYGVKASRIKAVGKGDLNPIADNETELGRAKNRRIEAVIH